MYVEDSKVKVTHVLDGLVQNKNKVIDKVFNAKLERGTHEVRLENSQDSPIRTQVTISLIEPNLLQSFQDRHKSGLEECTNAEFPLALENQKGSLTDD